MKRGALLALVVVVVLGGCTHSDIDRVKDQLMPENPTLTVGQAFGTRKVCASTTWTESTDDRGRKVVEYRCTIKGVADYVKADSADSRKALQNAAKRDKDLYLDDVKQLQTGIASAKSGLARAPSPTTASAGSTPLDPQSQAITESLTILQSGDTDAILAHDFGPRYSDFNRAVAEYRAFKGLPPMPTPMSTSLSTPSRSRFVMPVFGINSRCCAPASTDRVEQANMKFHAAQQAAVQLMNADLADQQQTGLVESTQDRIYQAQAIRDNQQKIDLLTAGQAAAFAAIDSKLKTHLAELDRAPLTGVDEVFRWLVTDRLDPVMSYSGMQMQYADATVDDVEYSDTERDLAIGVILRNEAMDYTQFEQDATPAVEQAAQ